MVNLKDWGIDDENDFKWTGDKYYNETIECVLQRQLNKLKEISYFDAVKHNIIEDNILEIWTCFLLHDKANCYNRASRLGYDLSENQLVNIFDTIVRDDLIQEIYGNNHQSLLLMIDPKDQSQEAVESFLTNINKKYESKFTLEDFNVYARNRVFTDANTESREKRKIKFKQLYETEQIQECIIPKKVTFSTVVKTEAILDGFLNKDAPTLITASGGTGKSALILNMALALGAPQIEKWLGFKKVKSKYTSMIVQQEDSESTITARLKLMCADPKMIDGIDSIYFIGNEGVKVTKKSLKDDSLTDYIEANIKSMYIEVAPVV